MLIGPLAEKAVQPHYFRPQFTLGGQLGKPCLSSVA
jgi:hypothetical protein